jgi:MSHA biogenesis protein MshL
MTSKPSAPTDRRLGFLVGACLSLLAGCAPVPPSPALQSIQQEMRQASQPSKPERLPAAVEAALLPDPTLALPKEVARPLEPRFDLVVNNAPAAEVFMGIVSGTRYSMLLNPQVAGSISVNLKDVTVVEAMEAIREQYGYDFRIDGSRIFVQPLTLQTRFYAISYLPGQRQGTSEMRVSSTVLTGGNNNTSGTGSTSSTSGTTGSSGSTTSIETSRLSTQLQSNFWGELQASIGLLIGCAAGGAGAVSCSEGRNIVASPHTGLLAIRAFPAEHRLVADYLRAAQLTVDRQVMIEAKIVEVTLNEGAQSGINWSYAKGSFSLSKGDGLPTNNSRMSSGFFTLGLIAGGFEALLQFLETQGTVHVLSSPRISAINNQKAVLKVGTDEYFVTGVSSTTTTSTATTTTPSVTLSPFFSGIALDVTPQIDGQDNIILHVHPSVTTVTEVTKQIEISGLNSTLPLASSNVSETDSIVRLKDGQIAAIGGLMKVESRDYGSKVPGAGDVPVARILFKNSSLSRVKSELVILLKPTIIRNSGDWVDNAKDAMQRIDQMTVAPKP